MKTLKVLDFTLQKPILASRLGKQSSMKEFKSNMKVGGGAGA